MLSANIYKIQKYSIDDGPGIRTTLFFKGCPLNCWWCHNPESQSRHKEIMYYENKCVQCERCVDLCPRNALQMENGTIKRDTDICKFCKKCVDECINNAMEIVGEKMTLKEVVKATEKDLIFYDQSGGGVTFSGGEPLTQFEFVYELANYYQESGINVALDTCGYIKWEKLAKIAPKIDLFLYDLKVMNNQKHKKFTGVDNELIHNNLLKLARGNNEIIIRIPVLAGINDDIENIKTTGKFLSDLDIDKVHLLPYHRSGVDKYERLNLEYRLPGMETVSQEKIKSLGKILKKMDLNITIRS